MNYGQHVRFNLFLAILLSAVAIIKHFNNFSFIDFWQGILLWTLILTCDLDSPKSRVTQLLGPFNPYKSFTGFGHREVLHHWTWGPFLLIVPAWMLLQAVDIDLGKWVIIGAVCAVEGHIIADWIDSHWKAIKKVFRFKKVTKHV